MTIKIDPTLHIGPKPLSGLPFSQAVEDPNFNSILKDRVAASKPLEWMMVRFLSHTIELFLSRPREEEDEFFSSPLFASNPSGAVSTKRHPVLPSQVIIPQTASSDPIKDEALAEPERLQDEMHDGDHQQAGLIEQAARKYGVDPSLIRAVIQVESGGNPKALSPAGAQGLMQLMPATAAELGVANPFDPMENVMAGTRYLRQLLDRYWGDTRLALAAYNWGMGNLEKRPEAMPKETKNYITKVEKLYRSQLTASL